MNLYPKEDILDHHDLYRRIKDCLYNPKKRKFAPPAFMLRGKENGLSVNWEKHSTPESTATDPVTGRRYLVGGVYARVPRSESMDVNHNPTANRAHTLISGRPLIESRYEVAAILADNCRPLITAL